MKKRIISVIFAVLIAVAVAGCAGNDACVFDAAQNSSARDVKVTVKVVNGDETLADQEVTIRNADTPTAFHATKGALDFAGVDFINAGGFVSSIGGTDGTDEAGWLLYRNGAITEFGFEEQTVEDGDQLEWRYLNYADIEW